MQWQYGASRLYSYYLLSSNIHSLLLSYKNFQVLFGHKAMQNKDISQPPLYLGVVIWSSFIQRSIGKTLVCDILKAKVVSNSLWPHRLYSPWNSPGQDTGMGSFSLLPGIFLTQGLNPGLPHCRWILYRLSHKGKPKNTGVGSLSLLQWIFLTQEWSWGLLHCRWILYQLSYQGSPMWYPSGVL